MKSKKKAAGGLRGRPIVPDKKYRPPTKGGY